MEWHPKVVDRTRERCEVVDEVHGLLTRDRLDHVVVDEGEGVVS
jgi:hypothetical protein